MRSCVYICIYMHMCILTVCMQMRVWAHVQRAACCGLMLFVFELQILERVVTVASAGVSYIHVRLSCSVRLYTSYRVPSWLLPCLSCGLRASFVSLVGSERLCLVLFRCFLSYVDCLPSWSLDSCHAPLFISRETFLSTHGGRIDMSPQRLPQCVRRHRGPRLCLSAKLLEKVSPRMPGQNT